MTRSGWAGAVLLWGGLQILVGPAAILVDGVAVGRTANAIPDAVFALVALVNGGVAVLLLLGGRRDARAVYLGAFFVSSGSAFSMGLLDHLAAGLPRFGLAIRTLGSLQVEALAPYFIWRFVSQFPQVSRYGRDLAGTVLMTRLSLVIGVALMSAAVVATVVAGMRREPSTLPLLRHLDRGGPVYWPVLLALIVAGLAASLSNLRRAKVEERRRVAWLFTGLTLGLAPPIVVNALAWLIPPFATWLRHSGGLQMVGLVAYPVMLASPFVIAYSVLVQHALDVRLVVRKAIQYALARYTLTLLVVLPFGVLLLFLFVNRHRTLSEVFSGSTATALLVLAVLGVAALAGRRIIAQFIDRFFFREQYDARQVLAGLAKASQQAREGGALGDMLVKEINRALHPRSACLMLRDQTAEAFVAASGYARPLKVDATLIRRLAESGRSYKVDWERSQDPVYSLPADEAEWLGDGGFRLLVPILSTTGGVAGLLGLTDKLSELPYSREDRALLEDIAMSASLTIENQALRSGVGVATTPSQEFATECPSCGTVSTPNQINCPTCAAAMGSAPVPLILAGKYQFHRRIGRGGMGVVYRAVDLALERDVAIKTLPWISPLHAQRLRREARAMASLSHPNLALIHAVESWHGTPLLVLEYLQGGTLADRLQVKALSLGEAVELGLVLTEVTRYIHEQGILHRDIKPSNIGFTGSGQPKLLDFGVAHLLASARPARAVTSRPAPQVPASQDGAAIEDHVSATITIEGEVVGTLLYLPPEALSRELPGPGFDLWSIGIVLYEAIAGINPMADSDWTSVMRRLAQCEIPNIRNYVPDLSAQVAEFFDVTLAKDPRRRPSTAGEMRARLAALRVDSLG